MLAKAETKEAGVENRKFQQIATISLPNIPCDLTKEMNTHTLCFCSLIRKFQAIVILKWAKECQRTKQRTSNVTREIQLIFSLQWKYSFLYFHGSKIQLFLNIYDMGNKKVSENGVEQIHCRVVVYVNKSNYILGSDKRGPIWARKQFNIMTVLEDFIR